jgi:hypothetical protein
MIKKSFLVVIYFLVTFPFFGQDTTVYKFDFVQKRLPFNLTYKDYSNKPIVGLVLSGGGSRGLSQIGILKAFEEKKVSFDYIIGTRCGILSEMYAWISINQWTDCYTIDWNDFFL